MYQGLEVSSLKTISFLFLEKPVSFLEKPIMFLEIIMVVFTVG